MKQIDEILQNLTPQEQQAVLSILRDQAAGKVDDIAKLYDADYDEIPVDIDTFLESPEYLGNSTNNGKAIYPYWRNAYREIIAKDKIEIALSGSIGSGKAAPLDSYLVGPDGYFRMADVKVGDLVAGQDGKFYHVTSIWPQGKIPIYRITFSDHTHVDCSIDHLWNIRRTDRPSKKQRYPNPSYAYETKSVRWLLQQDLKIGRGRVDDKGHKLEQNKFAIQCTLPVQFKTTYKHIIPPYLLGLLIADGGLSNDFVSISIYEQDIKERVSELLKPLNCYLKLSNPSENYPGLGDFNIVSNIAGYNPIIREIKKLKLNVKSVDKHIPKEYLISSVEDRMELLRGLVDGDGYICPAVYMYSTSSKQLYEDFCFLVYSLGGTVMLTKGKEAYRYLPDGSKIKSTHLNYEFTFHMPKALRAFHSEKHTKRFGKGTQYHEMEYRFIQSIEPVGEAECQCITVDNPESLYLMDNFTVTHNTTAAIYLMIYFFYKLMCLRNIRQYYQLEGNGPVCIAFLNNTLQLSKGVAYDKFMSTVANSPWFLERGEVRGTVNIRYKPKKNIEFIIGSSSDQIIGRDIFCLTGDTEIETIDGYKTLEDICGNYTRVYTFDGVDKRLSDNCCSVMQTGEVNMLYHITLSDGTILKCTGNHRFLMFNSVYIDAQHMLVGMHLITSDMNVIKIDNIEVVTYDEPVKVYDVIDVKPYHNFIIKTNSTSVVSHNCAIMDELNFCISGDSVVVGNSGSHRIDKFKDSQIFGYDADNDCILSASHHGSQPTAYVDSYLEIKLEDNTVLKCSHNHKFMLADSTYKEAQYLTTDDELKAVNPYGYVFLATCTATGKRYVGQNQGSFQRFYVGSGKSVKNDIRRYGIKSFSVEILEWAMSADFLDSIEAYYLRSSGLERAGKRNYSKCVDKRPSACRIRSIQEVNKPLQLYDVVDVQYVNNFLVANNSGGYIVSHNSKGADIQFEKNKVLETYNACFGRIKNRFTVNGRCQGRIFMVSSKKTEYDFLNQYIEKKLQSKEDAKNLYVADAKAFEVKPRGSYSGRMFRVAVGGSNLPSKIPEDNETTEELIHQGYEVYDVPVELRGDFELDINRFIADHLGIAVSEVIKFMPYNKIAACYKEITNPFPEEVIYANLSDNDAIKNHFRPELVPESISSRPMFIHLDTSGGKGDRCGISSVACMGYVNRNRYSEETGNEETTKQMLYRHVFSVGLDAVKTSEISFQKIVDFLWYLKFQLGWNIKAVSTDGYMGQFLRQQIAAAGFSEVNYVSLDRSPEGYLALQSIFAENRIALIQLKLLETELVRLERNNMTGKIDHPPIDGCFVGDTQVITKNGVATLRDLSQMSELPEILTYDGTNFVFDIPLKVWKTKDAFETLKIYTSDNRVMQCTLAHKIMKSDGTWCEARNLKHIDTLKALGGAVKIKEIEYVLQPNAIPVYDIHMSHNHNFALSNGVVVHNSKDIADSLAGAVFNALQHEKELQLGNEDLVDMVLDNNKVFGTKPSSVTDEEEATNVEKAAVATIKPEEVKQIVNMTMEEIKAEAARRATLTYNQPQEYRWDPRDQILD